MKKLFCGVTFIVTVLMFTAAAFAANEDIRITVDSKEVSFPDQKPYTDSNGRTKVPVRFISEALGAQVAWEENGQANTVTIRKADKTILLKVGEKKATVNGEEKQLDTQAEEKNNRVVVPLRFVSECLGAKVSWLDITQTITIRSDKPFSLNKTPEGRDPWLYHIKIEDDPLYMELASIEGFNSAAYRGPDQYGDGEEYSFNYTEPNPYNNNHCDVTLDVAYSRGYSVVFDADIEKNDDVTMGKFNKTLELIIPKYKDQIYSMVHDYIKSRTREKITKKIDDTHEIFMMPSASLTYPYEWVGCSLTVFEHKKK